MKKKVLCVITMCLILATLLQLSGCSASGHDTEQEYFSVINETVSELQLEESLDDLKIAQTGSGKLIIGGSNGNSGVIYIYEGEEAGDFSLDYKLESNHSICGIVPSRENGFSVLLKIGNGQQYRIEEFGSDGSLNGSLEIEIPFDVKSMICVDDKYYIFWNESGIQIIDEAGTAHGADSLENGRIITISATAEQILAQIQRGNQFGYSVINMSKCILGEFIEIEEDVLNISETNSAGETILLNDGIGLFSYDIESHECITLFSWEDAELATENIYNVIECDKSSYICSPKSGNKIFIINVEEHQVRRQAITVGCMKEENIYLEQFVSEFNKTNREYYAVLEHYTTADMQRLLSELIAGDGPDVLELSNMPIRLSAGYYHDMLDLIDLDEDICRDDFIGNVIESMLLDGKLISLVSSISVKTIAGRTADVGDNAGWSVEDLESVLENRGSPCRIFPTWLTSQELLLWVCNISGGEFIDWNDSSCSFNTDEFIKLLELCKSVPAIFDSAAIGTDYEESVLLTIQLISSIKYLDTLDRNYGGDEYSFIGFPNNGESNGSFYSKGSDALWFSIPESTEDKNAAWTFVRAAFLDEHQETSIGIPVIRSAAEVVMEQVMQEEDSVMSAADQNRFWSLLDETDTYIYTDSVVQDIILSEADAYFSGEKTAEEVAKTIQSRVKIYLHETK